MDRQPDDEAGLYDLVEQVRRIRALTAGGVFHTDLGPVTERLRRAADELEAASATPEERQAETWANRDYIRNCPVTGRGNPLSPPIEFDLLPDGTMRGEVTLGLEYQGPPACVHGGVVALLFDAVLGRANFHAGRKVSSQGALWAGGRLCAAAEGFFVLPGDLLRENQRRLTGG